MASLRGLIVKFIASGFFSGYLPVAPGTFGSLLGLAVYFGLKGAALPVAVSAAAALVLGFLTGGRAERIYGVKDPRYVVIDEVAGMLLSLLFLPYDPRLALIGFLMFRIFDTVKPFPAGRLQNLKGAAGIMTDDIIAAAYANLVLQLISRLI